MCVRVIDFLPLVTRDPYLRKQTFTKGNRNRPYKYRIDSGLHDALYFSELTSIYAIYIVL